MKETVLLSIEENLNNVEADLKERKITLVAVSKTKPVEDIKTAYNVGVRDFGENKVQEFMKKQPLLPDDIRWHLIGHLQRSKIYSR